MIRGVPYVWHSPSNYPGLSWVAHRSIDASFEVQVIFSMLRSSEPTLSLRLCYR